jgi:hypothetical protein
MKFYVLNYDWNKKEVVNYNIFNSVKFSNGIKEIMAKDPEDIDYMNEIDSLAKYCFWSKREYEISVGDAFDENLDNYEKIDVYRQVAMNISIITDYVIKNR